MNTARCTCECGCFQIWGYVPIFGIFWYIHGILPCASLRGAGSALGVWTGLCGWVTRPSTWPASRISYPSAYGNGEKKYSIDVRDNSIEKVIINRSALDFRAFCFLPNQKILIERKVKIIFVEVKNSFSRSKISQTFSKENQ